MPDELTGRILGAARRLFALAQADTDAVLMVRGAAFPGYTRLG